MSRAIPENGFYIDYKINHIFEVNENKEHLLISSTSGCSTFMKIERDGREIQRWANIVTEGKNPVYVITFEDNTIETYG